MAKAYSLDLRRKVLAAYQAGGDSQERVAARFEVSPSFARDLLALFRERGCGAAGALLRSPPQVSRASAAAAKNDATLQEHRESLAAAGCPLSASALSRALLAPRLTRKKRRSKTTGRAPGASRSGAQSSLGT